MNPAGRLLRAVKSRDGLAMKESLQMASYGNGEHVPSAITDRLDSLTRKTIMNLMTKHETPKVEWTPCTDSMPPDGVFVWVVVGKTIETGEARRYLREVHMGVWSDERFQIFPYKLPMLSQEVWAWAPMSAPEPPVCKQGDNGYSNT